VGLLLKERMASERARAVARQERLNTSEELLNMQLATINRHDTDS
jgi:hypothetical protein